MPKLLVGFMSAVIAGIIAFACGAILTKSSRDEKASAIANVKAEYEFKIETMKAGYETRIDALEKRIGASQKKQSQSKKNDYQRRSQPTKQDNYSQRLTQAQKKAEQIYKMGETVSIGYMSYYVWSAEWRDKIEYKKPNAIFLVIDLTVRNNDKEPRSIPSFILIDENRFEYEDTYAPVENRTEGIWDSLNPTVKQRGKIVFDIPTGHKYFLKASGGFWSSEYALIQIVP